MGRQIGRMVDDDKLTSYINEAEQLHIKPILGDTLYLQIVRDLEKNEADRDADITMLLDGGVYTADDCNCDGGKGEKYFEGLKKAIAYFVYAQYLMSGDIEATRFGTMLKAGDYSTHVSDKQRSDNYNNVLDMANAYLRECVAYCKTVGLIKTTGKSKVNFGGISIRRIG